MAARCHSCAVLLGDGESTISCAFCDALFHRSCCRLPLALVDAVITNVDLHWSCTGCTSMLKHPRSKAVKEIGQIGGFQAALVSAMSATKALLEPLANDIRVGLAALKPASTPVMNKAHRSVLQPVPASKRRRVLDCSSSPAENDNNMDVNTSPVLAHNSPSLPNELTGTDTSSSPLIAVARANKLWIRLSHISPSVKVEQIVSFVERRLGTQDVLAFSLMKKGTCVEQMNSVSFKVRIPADLRDMALSPATWPVGVGVREFIIYHRPARHRYSPSTIDPRSASLSQNPTTTSARNTPCSTRTSGTTTQTQALDLSTDVINMTLTDGPQQINSSSSSKQIKKGSKILDKNQATLDQFFHN